MSSIPALILAAKKAGERWVGADAPGRSTVPDQIAILRRRFAGVRSHPWAPTMALLLWPMLLWGSVLQANARPGSLDETFTQSLRVSGSLEHRTNSTVEVIVPQPDGKIFVGGSFTNVNGYSRDGIARLTADGAIDTGFTPPPLKLGFSGPRSYWTGGTVTGLAQRSDGEVVLVRGEYFNDPASAACFIETLQTNGIADPTFVAPNISYPNFFGNGFARLAVAADDSILVGGVFPGASLVGIFVGEPVVYDAVDRLNKTGSVDTNFDRALDQFAYCLVVAPDGKIIVGGGAIRPGNARPLVRLLPNGQLDSSFKPGVLFGPPSAPDLPEVYAVAIQPDGKVLAGGGFTSIGGQTANGIARLNADGSFDFTFQPGTGVAGGSLGRVNAIAVQADGKIVVAGDFSAIHGLSRNALARLNPDGSVDLDFQPGSGANGTIRALALQSDGQILMGGDFSSYDGAPAPSLARINGDRALFSPLMQASGFSVSTQTLPGQSYILEAKEQLDAAVWREVVVKPGDGGIGMLVDPGPLTPHRFYRVRIEQTLP